MALLLRPLLFFGEICVLPTEVTEAGCSHTPTDRTPTKVTKARSRHTSTNSPALLSQNFVGGLFHLNSFVCFFGAVLLSCLVDGFRRSCLRGLEVAGRSHGLGCTAASNAGAIQSCSLLDSLGRLRAAKSANMVRFALGFEDTHCAHFLGKWSAIWTTLLIFVFTLLQRTAGILQRR